MTSGVVPGVYPKALTTERLSKVAEMLWQVATGVALKMEPELGDGPWGAGTSRFERAVDAFTKAAKKNDPEWLSVKTYDGRLVLRIGGIPVRFYRGAKDAPVPERYRKVLPEEKGDLQTALGLTEDVTPKLLRIEVNVDAKQMPIAVTLVQVDEAGKKYNPYNIPVNKKAVSRSIARKRQAVVLPDPKVSPKAADIGTTRPAKEESA